MPEVSVLLPVYNTKEEYLRAAIDGILAQSFKNFELVILNDASSTEEADRIIRSYRDTRIVYVREAKNLGISGARNKLIDLARSELLAVMDHDDIPAYDRLAKQVSFMRENPETGIVGSSYYLMPQGRLVRMPETNEQIENAMMFSCPVLHPSAMIRKSVLMYTGIRYEKAYSPAEDYALFCRLIGKTKFANTEEPLMLYREHEANTSKTARKEMAAATTRLHMELRQNHAEIFKRAQALATVERKYRLFGMVFLCVAENRKNGRTDFRPFNLFSLFCLDKNETGRTLRLFGRLPVFKERIKIRLS